ncbi:MAG TPA: septum site-determining protein MinC [Roseiarcus sp.]|nr:septum site-determining protein MinC [Roseiarcus sp.]
MNAHVGPAQTLKFRAQSLLAYVLEPTQPLADWFLALDAWLARSPTFFIARPVILDMAGLELDLKQYRELLSDLARRHIRVMGAENVGRGLVGPHLPPVLTGGRTIDAPTEREEDPASATNQDLAPASDRSAPEGTESLIVDGNVRSGQSIMHPQGDVTIIGRVASGAEVVAGGSVHVYGALQGRVIAGISGSRSARIFCTDAKAELLCIGGAYMTAEDTNSEMEGRSVEARLDGDELKLRILS